jgi:hypothetical protein
LGKIDALILCSKVQEVMSLSWIKNYTSQTNRVAVAIATFGVGRARAAVWA